MLPKLKAGGHRILMFSQMVESINFLEQLFLLRGLYIYQLYIYISNIYLLSYHISKQLSLFYLISIILSLIYIPLYLS